MRMMKLKEDYYYSDIDSFFERLPKSFLFDVTMAELSAKWKLDRHIWQSNPGLVSQILTRGMSGGMLEGWPMELDFSVSNRN